MLQELRAWFNRFKRLKMFLISLPIAAAGMFTAYGTSHSLEHYLKLMLGWSIGFAVAHSIGWLLSQWIEFED